MLLISVVFCAVVRPGIPPCVSAAPRRSVGTPALLSSPTRSALNRVDRPRPSCGRCTRPLGQCLCCTLPPLPLKVKTKILVLQHPAERKKQIASVPLIPLCVQDVSVIRGVSFDDSVLRQASGDDCVPLLLFPGPSATSLDGASNAGGPAHYMSSGVAINRRADGEQMLLVLIDGTWSQAGHMLRHSPSLVAACTHIMFESPAASVFNALRREPERHCMSTVEACARALRHLEPASHVAAAAADHMETSLQRMVDQQLACAAAGEPRFVRRMRRIHRPEERRGAVQGGSAGSIHSDSSADSSWSGEPLGAGASSAVESRESRHELQGTHEHGGAAASHVRLCTRIREELAHLLSADEIGSVEPLLLERNASVAEVRSRIAQARFVLSACSRIEAAVIRTSIVEQTHYLSQQMRIAYEDPRLLVCEKPFDTQIAHGTHQTRRYEREVTTVEMAAKRLQCEPSTLRPCHQLDFSTSGLLVLAKDDAALSSIAQAFDSTRGGRGRFGVQKEYTAVVLGWPSWDVRDWEGELDVDPTSAFKMRVVSERREDGSLHPVSEAHRQRVHRASAIDTTVAARWGPSRMPPAKSWSSAGRQPRARLSSTRVEVLRTGLCALPGALSGRRVSLVRLTPTTGRRHQLRVTLAHLGHPILGDVAYAGDLHTYRLMLHASALTFCARPAVTLEQRSGTGAPSSRSGAGRRARARARRALAARAEASEAAQPHVLSALGGRRLETEGDCFAHVLECSKSIEPARREPCARREPPRCRPAQMRLMRSLDPATTDRRWEREHHGASRVVWRHDSAAWLHTGASPADVRLPPSFDVITGLPDISEIKPRLTPPQYEAWCISVVRRLIEMLSPDRVAIFYVTPGRYTGEGGAWLDKGFLCQSGGRQAGAACVWQKVVLIQDSPGRTRGGRPGFVNMLCFSRRHRVPRDFVTVDVLPDRGQMSWSHAIGEEACRHAVEYCQDYVSGYGNEQVPILNPFCGYGSVLAVANAYGIDAFGMDISLKCCRKAAEHRASLALLRARGIDVDNPDAAVLPSTSS